VVVVVEVVVEVVVVAIVVLDGVVGTGAPVVEAAIVGTGATWLSPPLLSHVSMLTNTSAAATFTVMSARRNNTLRGVTLVAAMAQRSYWDPAASHGRGDATIVTMGRYEHAPVDRAAGGVVVHQGCILVVHRPRYDDWSLPKGHVDPGESWAEAAIREVREETGVDARIVGEPISISYVLEDGTPKVVVFHPMVPVAEPFELRGDPDEVDTVQWWSFGRAGAELSYVDERRVVEAFGSTNMHR